MNNYGKQIAFIATGGGLNIESAVKEYTAAGYVAVELPAGYSIHEAPKEEKGETP